MTKAEEDERAGQMQQRRKVGRPTLYSKALVERICNLIAQGQHLHNICEMEGFPTAAIVHMWLVDGQHKEFFELYQRAREVKAGRLFDETLDIADDEDGDIIEGLNGPMANPAHVNRDKLRIHARHVIAARLAPKLYGEQSQVGVQVNMSLTSLIGQSLTGAESTKLMGDLRAAAPGVTTIEQPPQAALPATNQPVERLKQRRAKSKKVKRNAKK